MSDYEVGKGKPPKHSQFRPNQSGNPRGRPRKLPRIEIPSQLGRDVRAIGRKSMKIKTPVGTLQVTLMEAFVWRIFMDAMAGRVTAQRLLIVLIREGLMDNLNIHGSLAIFDQYSSGYVTNPHFPLGTVDFMKLLAKQSKMA